MSFKFERHALFHYAPLTDLYFYSTRTALHFAAGANSVSSVRILAEHGAKLTIEVCLLSHQLFLCSVGNHNWNT